MAEGVADGVVRRMSLRFDASLRSVAKDEMREFLGFASEWQLKQAAKREAFCGHGGVREQLSRASGGRVAAGYGGRIQKAARSAMAR